MLSRVSLLRPCHLRHRRPGRHPPVRRTVRSQAWRGALVHHGRSRSAAPAPGIAARVRSRAVLRAGTSPARATGHVLRRRPSGREQHPDRPRPPPTRSRRRGAGRRGPVPRPAGGPRRSRHVPSSPIPRCRSSPRSTCRPHRAVPAANRSTHLRGCVSRRSPVALSPTGRRSGRHRARSRNGAAAPLRGSSPRPTRPTC